MSRQKRIREWMHIPGRFQPGPSNSITDVEGVLVGHHTLHDDEKHVHTGVTIIRPHMGDIFHVKVPAAIFCANGFGKIAGAMQIEELGEIESLISLTNTFSVAQVLQGMLNYHVPDLKKGERSINIIVGETNDAYISDMKHFQVTTEHVQLAIDACSKHVEEGAVGAGAGTRCFGYKGGIGTASRRIDLYDYEMGQYLLGALVQTNFDGNLNIYGRSVSRGSHLQQDAQGSCMIIIATDAPLSDRQLKRLAKRAIVGMTNTGSFLQNGSGDFVIAFSNYAENLRKKDNVSRDCQELNDEFLDLFFEAAAEAVQESIYNSLTMARALIAVDGSDVPALDLARYFLPTTVALPARTDGSKTIGIIGGMGPDATVDLFQKIIKETQINSEKEHLHILIDNDPSIPDRTDAILHYGESPLPALIRSATLLEGNGAQILVMACNTAHFFHTDIQKSVRVPLLNMLSLTSEFCSVSGYHTIGLLSTTGTAKSGIYSMEFLKLHITCLLPDENEMMVLMDCIYRFKERKPLKNLDQILMIIEHFKQSGASAIVLGCTELPLLLEGLQSPLPIIDPTRILANTAVKLAKECNDTF